MVSTVRSLTLNILRAVVPYPDPVRRRRVRETARSLVGTQPWPSDDAVTGADVARLALLRLLWLQRQCRRTSGRSSESAVLIARSAIEACILGMYCLGNNDAVPSLKAAAAMTMKNVLGYLVDDELVPQSIVDQALVAAIGSPKRGLSVEKMARHVESAPNGFRARSLYRRFYVPTSEFFVHANAMSLLRHVQPNGQLHEQPLFPWTRRSAVHVCDACLAILGAAIARQSETPSRALDQYSEAHLVRAVTPIAAVAGSGFRRSATRLRLPGLMTVMWSVWNVRRYVASAQALADAPNDRKVRVSELLEQVSSLFKPLELPEQVLQLFHDHLVDTILTDIANREQTG